MLPEENSWMLWRAFEGLSKRRRCTDALCMAAPGTAAMQSPSASLDVAATLSIDI